ncbi:MAG: hypothetical protein GX072_14365 [Lysinibacillus sp.]|nr:hypothetical protein [Lysinibacillus sp.]
MNVENLIDSIRGLEGFEIGLYLNENKTVHGTLLSIRDDHIVVKINENIYYFPYNHIKAISKSAKDIQSTTSSSQMIQLGMNLEEILQNMQLQWITVNSFIEPTFSGVLSKIARDHILLIDGQKQLFILKSHIVNILNEQIDEDQIANQQQNSLVATNLLSVNPIASTIPNNSNLQQNINFASFLTEEQKREFSDLARKKFKKLVPVSKVKTILQKQRNSNQQHAENTESSDNIQMNLEQESVDKSINASTIASTENIETPQSIDEKAISQTKKSIKKVEKSPFLQELKFNSPLETCTWSAISEDNKKESKMTMDEEKLSETTEISKVEKETVPLSTELAVQVTNEELNTQQDAVETAEILEDYNTETIYEKEPIQILMEDNRRLLECQYYALMKFAERMYHLENQYQTIMNHAKKMYLQLKERQYY